MPPVFRGRMPILPHVLSILDRFVQELQGEGGGSHFSLGEAIRAPGFQGKRESKRALPLSRGLAGIPPVQRDNDSHVRPDIAVQGVRVGSVGSTGNPVEQAPVQPVSLVALQASGSVWRMIRSSHLPPFSLRNHGQGKGTVGNFNVEIPHDNNWLREVLLRILDRGLKQLVEVIPVRFVFPDRKNCTG